MLAWLGLTSSILLALALILSGLYSRRRLRHMHGLLQEQWVIVRELNTMIDELKDALVHARKSEAEPMTTPDASTRARNVSMNDAQRWSVAGWLRSLSLHRVVAEAMGANLDFEQVRSLSSADLEALLRAGGITKMLHGTVWRGIQSLGLQEASTAKLLSEKFSISGAFEMAYGGIDIFFAGLESLIGPPLLVDGSLRRSLQREHIHSPDSTEKFTSSNGVTTTSMIEWHVVVDPEPASLYPQRRGRMGDVIREINPLSKYVKKMVGINEQLRAIGQEDLLEEEMLASRLYTGPMYEKYNIVLRSFSGVTFLQNRCAELTKGNKYASTLHTITSAVLKLSTLTRVGNVWRGFIGARLPPSFFEPNEQGVLGGIEFGFTSTTTAREQAYMYAQGNAQTVFEMRMGMISKGADLSWLSQYSAESEILFPPLLGFEVRSTRVDGSTLVVELDLSLNLLNEKIEKTISRRRKLVVDMGERLRIDLKHGMDANEQWSMLDAMAGAGGDARGVASSVLEAWLTPRESQEPAFYNDDMKLTETVHQAVEGYAKVSLLSEELVRIKHLNGDAKPVLYAAKHPHWDGDSVILLRRDGSFQRGVERTHTAGTWSINGNALGLAWDSWAPEVLYTNDEGKSFEAASGFQLFGGEQHEWFTTRFAHQRPDTVAVRGDFARTLLELEALSLAKSFLVPTDGCTLAALLLLSGKLVRLDLGENKLGPAGAEAIFSALANNQVLTDLDFRQNCIEDVGAVACARMLERNRTLRSINLRGSRISDIGAVPLAHALQGAGVTLTSLSLRGNFVKSAGAEAFGDMLQTNTSLTMLNLEKNTLGPGAMSIGKGLSANPNSSLRDLNLYWTTLSDETVQQIASAVATCSSIITINLSAIQGGAVLDTAGVALARAMAESSSFQSLNLSRTKLSLRAANALKAPAHLLGGLVRRTCSVDLTDAEIVHERLQPVQDHPLQQQQEQQQQLAGVAASTASEADSQLSAAAVEAAEARHRKELMEVSIQIYSDSM